MLPVRIPYPQQDYTILTALVILVYDYTLTFADEIEQIWAYRLNLFTMVWLLLRYLGICFFITQTIIIFYPDWSPSVSNLSDKDFRFTYQRALFFLKTCFLLANANFPIFGHLTTVILSHLIMAFRIHALYGRKMSYLMVLLTIPFIEGALVAIFLQCIYGSPIPLFTAECLLVMVQPQCIELGACFWAGPLIGDFIVYICTLRRCRQYRNVQLFDTFLGDGSRYFTVVSVLHLLNMLIALLAEDARKPILTSITNSFSITLVCRLVLTFRKKATEEGMVGESPPAYTTFATVTNFFEININPSPHPASEFLPYSYADI